MRKSHTYARPARLAALLAAGLATAALGLVASLSSESGAQRAASSTQTATVHGDGRTGPRGDENRDGRIDEDESGWDCRTTGNRVCGNRIVPDECKGAGAAVELCVTVVRRPAYDWQNPEGSRVDIPDGRAEVRGLDEKPGTPEFTAALRTLDAEWRAHH
ncbi:hypothetical protein ABT039_18190 [Streptomyces lasiicapitis]|uniref:hypothetical protein n=1 Tax=Streptomyces lasiicapitis TaxID=1923961 RepID=UPI003321B72B